MYDFHIHTIFSADCKYDLEHMVRSGLGKKMKLMYAADHFELRDNPEDDMIFDLSEYCNEIKRINKKYNNIEVLSGLELSTDIKSCSRFVEMAKNVELDMVLLSTHRIKDTYLGDKVFDNHEHALKLYLEYYNGILETIQSFKDYQVLGHLDLIDKFKYEYFIELEFIKYKNVIAEILNQIIKNDKALEVNTSGFREEIGRFYPRLEILTMYKKMGGDKIIIGSDAHFPEYVAYENKRTQKLLKKLGFNHICIYRKAKPHLVRF